MKEEVYRDFEVRVVYNRGTAHKDVVALLDKLMDTIAGENWVTDSVGSIGPEVEA